MQKVVGSSPIIRFRKGPANAGFFRSLRSRDDPQNSVSETLRTHSDPLAIG
jgi:hypothetical protein